MPNSRNQPSRRRFAPHPSGRGPHVAPEPECSSSLSIAQPEAEIAAGRIATNHDGGGTVPLLPRGQHQGGTEMLNIHHIQSSFERKYPQ